MVRSILGILAGIVAGGVLVGILEIPGMVIHPLPPGTDTSNWDAIKAHAEKAPLPALVLVAVAWTLGPLVGSWLAAMIARRGLLMHAVVVGMFFLAANILNIRSLPHPAWLNVVGVVSPLVTCVLGAWLAEKTIRKRPGPRPHDMRDKNMAC